VITLRVAWRNLFRNRRRTAITVVAVSLTTAILIASLALMQGMVVQMVRHATRLVTGDAQVHAPEYRSERSIYEAIPNAAEIVAAAEKADMKAAPRSFGFGLVSSGTKSAGATFWGVDPAAERSALELAVEVARGAFLPDTPQKKMVIGRKLAKSLHADIGTEIVTVVQAADGSLGNELFTVSGILKNVGEDINRGGVFVHARDFEELFVSAGRVHEIAISAGARPHPEIEAALASSLKGAELLSWKELMPAVADMLIMTDASLFLFSLIFFLAAGLGVLNTMLMATHDRVREFGVLKALGCTPWRIIRDVATEGFVLALVSTLVGAAIGVPLAWWLQQHGLDLRAFGDADFSFSGIAWDPLWRAELRLEEVINSVAMMWVVCVIASLYPAAKAARLDPARAMTHV